MHDNNIYFDFNYLNQNRSNDSHSLVGGQNIKRKTQKLLSKLAQ